MLWPLHLHSRVRRSVFTFKCHTIRCPSHCKQTFDEIFTAQMCVTLMVAILTFTLRLVSLHEVPIYFSLDFLSQMGLWRSTIQAFLLIS